MTYVTTSNFRKDMAMYLDQVSRGQVVYIGRRNKKEFIVVPTSLIDEEDIEIMQSKYLAGKIAKARTDKTYPLEEVAADLGIDL